MRRRVRATGTIVVVVLALGGCASDDTNESAEPEARSTTTTGSGLAPTEAPEDDGGEFCRVFEEKTAAFPLGDPPSTIADAGQDLIDRATFGTDQILPAAPEQIRADAVEFLAVLRAAGEELVAYDGPLTDPGALTDDAAPALAAYREMVMVTSEAGDLSKTTYPNLFLAWTSDPCGPKPLEPG